MNRSPFVIAAVALLVSCNQHPVSYVESLAIVEFQQPLPVDPIVKLDMLWVIDNSGSMCQEQAVLRQNFDRVVDTLEGTGTDFQLGVTTTHMQEDSPIEPVARPGMLQSTPQPVVGFDDSCYEAVDEKGFPIEGDFTPVRQLIDIAVDCMQTPEESYRNVTDDDIRCALGLADSATCEIPGRCSAGTCQHEALFPPANAYRTLPKVLRSEDYRGSDGVLDADSLKADFACMSTVGVRGSGFEKGLGAAVLAVDPAMTGGAVGAENVDPSAPNHGLIRKDARLAVLFVTDENDCTHDGRLAESTQCGGDICEYWNHPELEEISPLVAPEQLRDELLENVRATKGVDALAPDDVLAVSIHGNSRRYDGDVLAGPECFATGDSTLPSACGAFDLCKADDGYEPLPPTCATALGSAYSGDRYSRFLKSFGDGYYFPSANPQDPEQPLFGWMCTGDFRPALGGAAAFISKVPTGCITKKIVTCAGEGASCPDHPYSGEPGTCTARSNSEEYFCDSYVQIRVSSEDPGVLEGLADQGFCYSDSLSGGTCVVDRSKYALGACSGDVSGVKIDWANIDEARQRLAGTTVELRYTGYAAP